MITLLQLAVLFGLGLFVAVAILFFGGMFAVVMLGKLIGYKTPNGSMTYNQLTSSIDDEIRDILANARLRVSADDPDFFVLITGMQENLTRLDVDAKLRGGIDDGGGMDAHAALAG